MYSFIPTRIVSIYCSALIKKQNPPGGVVVHAFNLGTLKAEAG